MPADVVCMPQFKKESMGSKQRSWGTLVLLLCVTLILLCVPIYIFKQVFVGVSLHVQITKLCL